MAVTDEMAMVGSVSGGCVETAVIEEALDSIATEKPCLLHFGVSDDTAWEVGLTCGGRISVFVEPLDTAWWHAAADDVSHNRAATTVTTGRKKITSSGQDRAYFIDIPDDYDTNKPYRLFFAFHWISSTCEAVRDLDYYSLKLLATAANEPAIFIAPQSDGAIWQEKDHTLFDDILAFVKENLCIDTTRVFATGFSFGGMITYSLSVNHQKDIRAAVGIAPANYQVYVPPATHEPIAWMQTTGMSDATCPWVREGSTTEGAKYIAIEHATDNGCTVPTDIPTWQQGDHVCYDFEGCDAGFPAKVCTFAGGHTNVDSDAGSSTNWIAQESWDFFMQF